MFNKLDRWSIPYPYTIFGYNKIDTLCYRLKFTAGERYILQTWFETSAHDKDYKERVRELDKSLKRFYVWSEEIRRGETQIEFELYFMRKYSLASRVIDKLYNWAYNKIWA